jgi:hypothetical protein
MTKMKAPFYKLNMNMAKFLLSFDLTAIETKPVNATEFVLPKNVFVK